jgi:plastocyanin
VGDINNGNIYHFKLSEDRTKLLYPNGQPIDNKPTTSAQIPLLRFGEDFGGITDLQTGTDGFLYVLAINGAIFRIVSNSFAAANPASDTLSTLVSQGQQQLRPLSTLPANIANKVTIMGVNETNSYDPNPINIKTGDTVTWINADVIAHTVTSGKDYNRLTSGMLFHSGSIISNTAYSHAFTSPGVYDYVCMFHPDMKGQVVVVSKTQASKRND